MFTFINGGVKFRRGRGMNAPRNRLLLLAAAVPREPGIRLAMEVHPGQTHPPCGGFGCGGIGILTGHLRPSLSKVCRYTSTRRLHARASSDFPGARGAVLPAVPQAMVSLVSMSS